MTREPSDSIVTDFKTLRLHGMAATWAELIEQNNGELEGSRWLDRAAAARGDGRPGDTLGLSPDELRRNSRCIGTSRGSSSRSRRWTASW